MKSFDDERLGTSYQALRVTYILVPLLAGLDKFTNLLTNWSHYLSPAFARMIPMSPRSFMYLVGIVEIVAGLLVVSRRTARVGAYIVMAWLLCIAINLLTIRMFDIAVRDAYAMGTCAGCHRHETDTRHFMHITFVGAMEPLDRVDDRARIGLDASTPDDTVALSNVLAADIADGGGRNTDYRNLLATNLRDLREFVGRPACASHGR